MAHATCETCRWWDSSVVKSDAQPETTGLCRINPPVADERTGSGIWPFTDTDDWCRRHSRQRGSSA